MEKSGKIFENCNAWKRQMSITLLITHEFVTVNFLPVYDTMHLKSLKFKNLRPIR